MNAADSNRHSLMIPTNMETAKYGREQAIKDIHSNFMKTYKETNNKLKNDGSKNAEESGERRSKAYQKIISNAQPSYMDEAIAKRQCVSEMFMDTNKFSTKTLSAINGLEGAVIRKNKEYNWRKEMEQYEKRADFERDVRARNVTALHRNDTDETEDHWVNARKRQTNTVIEKPIEKAAKQESKQEVKSVKSWRERREAAKAIEAAEPQPEVAVKSWREKLAEKQQNEEEEKKIAAAEAEEARKQAAAAVASAVASAEATAESAEPAAAAEEKKPAEAAADEDASGTKKLKSDFDFLMSGMDAELEAGRSKLAKLRERIRKAKNAIKDADTALAEDDKKIEEQKSKKLQK